MVVGMSFAVAAVPLVFFVAVIVVLAIRARAGEATRIEGFTQDLRAAGWTAGHQRDPEGRRAGQALAGRVVPLPEVTKRPKGVVWWATREIGGREVTLLEHAYTESSGESSHTVTHLVAMAACPAAWPTLRVAETGFFGGLAKSLGFRGIEVEDPEFNRRFSVKGDSAEFALLLLSPEVRAVLGRERGGPRLGVGGGTVMIWVRQRPAAVAGAAALAERLAELVAGIPSELDVWGA